MREIRHRGAAGELQRLDLFPAPFFTVDWPEAKRHAASLLRCIAVERVRHSGIARTNVGGWHSDVDLPSRERDAFGALCTFVARSADAATAEFAGCPHDWRTSPWRMICWANVNPPGGAHNRMHTHSNRNWQWSACYYCAVGPAIGDGPESGRMVLANDRTGLVPKGRPPPDDLRLAFVPRAGQLALFPSWLMHAVEPHRDPGDRVTIAFNLHCRDIERSRFWTARPGALERRMPKLFERLRRLRGGAGHDAEGVPAGFDVS